MNRLLNVLMVVFLLQLLVATNSFAVTNERALKLKEMRNEKRVALIIGNADYAVSPLRNPVNDAKLMAKTLRGLGFKVTTVLNASQKEMKRGVAQFGKDIRNGGVGFFYYAGHGMQVDGYNYMIPVDASIESEEDVEYESIAVGRVLAKMKAAGNRMNIIMLDACRNNPYASRFRSATKGLATLNAPRGSFIAYATAPGSVASDGSGANGLFTSEFISAIQVNGLTIEEVFKKVGSKVIDRTGGKQIPWQSSSLTGDFYFSIPTTTATVGTQVQSDNRGQNMSTNAEVAFWNAISTSTNPAMFKEYLKNYPNGMFAGIAKIKLSEFEKAEIDKLTAGLTSSELNQKAADLFKDGKFTQKDKVKIYLDKALELDPKNKFAYGNMAFMLEKDEKFEESLTFINEAIALDNDYEWALKRRGSIYKKLGEYDQAVKDYLLLVKLDPKNTYYYGEVAYAYYKENNYNSALKYLNDAIKVDANYAYAYKLKGYIYKYQKAYDKAITNYSIAIDKAKDERGNYTNRGDIFYYKKEYYKAIDDYHKAIQIDPKYDYAYQQLIRIYDTLKQYTDSAAIYTKRIKLNPSNWRLYFKKGKVEYLAGQYQQALNDFNTAVSKASSADQVSVLYDRGRAYNRIGKYRKAIADFKEYNKAFPENYLSHNMLSWVYSTSPDAGVRDGRQAVKYAEKALAQKQYGYIFDTAGAAYAAVGDFDKAIYYQKKAIENASSSVLNQYKDRLALYQKRQVFINY